MIRSSNVSRRIATLVLLAIALTTVFAVVSGAAFADAGTHASCMGHESSSISPVGSSDELPGGRPQLNAFFKEAFPDTPQGAIVKQIAHVHAGSHEACDEAFE